MPASMGNNTSRVIKLSTGATRCAQPTADSQLCFPKQLDHICKFVDDMTVVDLISNNDESPCRAEVQQLVDWCQDNNLPLNVVEKTTEMVVDLKMSSDVHTPLSIHSLDSQ